MRRRVWLVNLFGLAAAGALMFAILFASTRFGF